MAPNGRMLDVLLSLLIHLGLVGFSSAERGTYIWKAGTTVN